MSSPNLNQQQQSPADASNAYSSHAGRPQRLEPQDTNTDPRKVFEGRLSTHNCNNDISELSNRYNLGTASLPIVISDDEEDPLSAAGTSSSGGTAVTILPNRSRYIPVADSSDTEDDDVLPRPPLTSSFSTRT